jgi:chromosome segregation ATPase
MAKANRCSTCQKQSGPMHCTGCDAYFCAKDFRGHREILFNEMEGLVEKRNDLQEKINKTTQKNDSNSSLIEEINKWEKLIIEQVKKVAETARQEAFQLLNSKRVKITYEFKTFSEELADLKESENFVEQDLASLKQKIREFHQDLTQLTQPVTIELNTKQSDGIQWNRLIYVQEKSTSAECQQSQQQAAGTFLISYLNETSIVIS